MSHEDIYLALLAIAAAIFTYAAFAKDQPKRVALVPLGLAIWVLAVFLRAAGFL